MAAEFAVAVIPAKSGCWPHAGSVSGGLQRNLLAPRPEARDHHCRQYAQPAVRVDGKAAAKLKMRRRRRVVDHPVLQREAICAFIGPERLVRRRGYRTSWRRLAVRHLPVLPAPVPGRASPG